MATVPALSSSNYQEESDAAPDTYENAASEAPHEDTPIVYTPTASSDAGGAGGGGIGAGEGQQLNEGIDKLGAEQTLDEQQRNIVEQGISQDTDHYNEELKRWEATTAQDEQHYKTEQNQYAQSLSEWEKTPEAQRGLKPQPPIPTPLPAPPQPPNETTSQGTLASLGSQIGTIIKQIGTIKSQNK
jgi:hypothetical protein